MSANWMPSSPSLLVPCSYSSQQEWFIINPCSVRDPASISVAPGILNHHWLWSLASDESLISTLCLLLICLFSIPGYPSGHSLFFWSTLDTNCVWRTLLLKVWMMEGVNNSEGQTHGSRLLTIAVPWLSESSRTAPSSIPSSFAPSSNSPSFISPHFTGRVPTAWLARLFLYG